MANLPERGEIWLANLNPTKGHEQSGLRPVLVVSATLFSQGPAQLVIVLPITSRDRNIPAHVAVDPPEGGLTVRSFILCDAIRSISRNRLTSSAWGTVGNKTMAKVEDFLRLLLEL
ncbi:MAG: type II toxin-antitoxin system PemK/MazF family toxin [Chloroflexota bacterium]